MAFANEAGVSTITRPPPSYPLRSSVLPAPSAATTRPLVEESEAAILLEVKFGIRSVRLKPLPSYDDQNYHVTAENGTEYVLKIHNVNEDETILAMQNALIQHLDVRGVPVSTVCPTSDGGTMVRHVTSAGEMHIVRVLKYVPGVLLRDVGHTPALLRDLGSFLGRMDRELADFSHPAAHARVLHWDIVQVLDSRSYLGDVVDPDRRRLLCDALAAMEERVLPRLVTLRRAVVHNDAHELNVLVHPTEPRITAIIDFGDAVCTAVACNVAIAQAYAMMLTLNEQCDSSLLGQPAVAFAAVREGYAAVHPLTREEHDLLPWLVLGRLCISVLSSAHKQHLFPHDEYVRVSEKPAWALINLMWPLLSEGHSFAD